MGARISTHSVETELQCEKNIHHRNCRNQNGATLSPARAYKSSGGTCGAAHSTKVQGYVWHAADKNKLSDFLRHALRVAPPIVLTPTSKSLEMQDRLAYISHYLGSPKHVYAEQLPGNHPHARQVTASACMSHEFAIMMLQTESNNNGCCREAHERHQDGEQTLTKFIPPPLLHDCSPRNSQQASKAKPPTMTRITQVTSA